MKKVETLEDFYRTQLNSVPSNLWNEIGHFDVFSFHDYASCMVKPIPFRYRNYLKIGLIFGENKVYFSDKTYNVKKQILFFANSEVPYSWEPVGEKQSGYFLYIHGNIFSSFRKSEELFSFSTKRNSCH